MKKLALPLLLILPCFTFCQNISGRIYDGKAPLENILIINSTKNIHTLSDIDGYFNIKASLNDSIRFTSSFYGNQALNIRQQHLDEKIVVVLKEDVNKLDEVIINSNLEPKDLEIEKYLESIKGGIALDIKKHPWLYGISTTEVVIKKISKFISQIKKNKKPKINTISYDQFYSLFENSSLFNDTYLIQDLHIKKDYKSLFFDYCEFKQINSNLLIPQNQIILLDTFLKISLEFIELVTVYSEIE